MAQATKTCSYKGRTYKLLFKGQTKFGMKAKLAFMDGSKEFWVSADAISGEADAGSGGSTSANRRRGEGCPGCGKMRKLVYDMEDGLYKCYDCCDMPSER